LLSLRNVERERWREVDRVAERKCCREMEREGELRSFSAVERERRRGNRGAYVL
jgi:hypothetical protein